MEKGYDDKGFEIPEMTILSYQLTRGKWFYAYYSYQKVLAFTSSAQPFSVVVDGAMWENNMPLRMRHREAVVLHAQHQHAPASFGAMLDLSAGSPFNECLQKAMSQLGLLPGSAGKEASVASGGRRVVLTSE